MSLLEMPVQGFLNAARLWWLLVVPALVLAYVLLSRRKSKVGIRYTNTSVLSIVLPRQSQWVRHVTVGLAILSLVTLIVAWARPVGVDKVPRERATVVLVIDVSLSMEATDVKPTRLEAAKTAASAFVTKLPAQYNVALVSLSGNPAQRVPPTLDRGAVLRAITNLKPQESTAIGDSITVALAALDLAPPGTDKSKAPGMIVLLSDGANTAGQAPLQTAQDAAERGVPVHTISYGTDNGYVDVDGKRERVNPDPQTLADIAKATKGKTYTADNVSQLDDAYRAISSEVGYEETVKEVTASAAGIGLVFAVLAAVGALVLGARWV
ncbi:MAG: VWA domain-containing protein [Actinomycetia bacterium]|nr:VWA domain-containing protein [Actinomycetes bacterium]